MIIIAGAAAAAGGLPGSAKMFNSLRSYSAAISAAGTQPLVKLRRGSDSATADILVAAGGGLGVTANATVGSNGVSANSWGGNAATGTGSITGTALTFTGGQVGGQVTGGTVAAGTYIVSGTSPNWTVNISQTVASATLTVANTLFVNTLYDQSGNSNDLVQATSGNQPHLILTGGPSSALPWMNFHGTAFLSKTSGFTSVPQPWVMTAIALRRVSGTQYIFSGFTGSAGPIISWDEPSSGNIGFYADGSRLAALSITANTWYSIQGTGNGVSGQIRTNGTVVSGNAGSGAIPANFIGVGSNYGGGAPMTGALVEVGAWPSAVSASAIETDQRAYWGF